MLSWCWTPICYQTLMAKDFQIWGSLCIAAFKQGMSPRFKRRTTFPGAFWDCDSLLAQTKRWQLGKLVGAGATGTLPALLHNMRLNTSDKNNVTIYSMGTKMHSYIQQSVLQNYRFQRTSCINKSQDVGKIKGERAGGEESTCLTDVFQCELSQLKIPIFTPKKCSPVAFAFTHIPLDIPDDLSLKEKIP